MYVYCTLLNTLYIFEIFSSLKFLLLLKRVNQQALTMLRTIIFFKNVFTAYLICAATMEIII